MKKTILTTFAALAVLSSCGQGTPATICVIPQPGEVYLSEGSLDLTDLVIKPASCLDEASRNYVEIFAKEENATVASGANVFYKLDKSLEDEAYTLVVGRKSATIKASSLNGFVYGSQTLRQLRTENPVVPCMTVKDAPRFHYRGMHLDCARHFFSTDEVRRYIDIMVLHKINTLHWHLTDDQGWRIQIDKYPLLTEVGSMRKGTMIGKDFSSDDGIPYGGFYTKEELKSIVEYAAERGVTVIPEIDLPGHMQAALAAYPELGCTGGPYDVWKVWGISDDVLCAGNEKIYTFLEDVFTELMDIFPSEYIHIGGDECPKVRWENCPCCQAKIKELGISGDENFTAEDYLQSYVMTRIEKFLEEHGRKIIGWDEILEGDVSESATIMSWRGTEGGIEAAHKGHDVIMTPNTYFYLDYYQEKDRSLQPLAIGGYLPIERCYSYEPYDESMTEEECHRIIGVQANLWTEYIATPEHLEYMLLPRMSALSEVQWCQPEKKDYDAFKQHLLNMRKLYDKGGYNYATFVFE